MVFGRRLRRLKGPLCFLIMCVIVSVMVMIYSSVANSRFLKTPRYSQDSSSITTFSTTTNTITSSTIANAPKTSSSIAGAIATKTSSTTTTLKKTSLATTTTKPTTRSTTTTTNKSTSITTTVTPTATATTNTTTTTVTTSKAMKTTSKNNNNNTASKTSSATTTTKPTLWTTTTMTKTTSTTTTATATAIITIKTSSTTTTAASTATTTTKTTSKTTIHTATAIITNKISSSTTAAASTVITIKSTSTSTTPKRSSTTTTATATATTTTKTTSTTTTTKRSSTAPTATATTTTKTTSTTATATTTTTTKITSKTTTRTTTTPRPCNYTLIEEFITDGPYVCSSPIGGLGNRLFVYASAYGIASSANRTLLLDDDNLLLKYFNISATLVPGSEYYCLLTNYTKKHAKHDCSFDPKMFDLPEGNTKVGTYMQSYKYFENVTHDIKREFSLRQTFLDKARKIIDNSLSIYFDRTNSSSPPVLIGVHIRRGNFIKNSFGYDVATPEYMNKSTEYFREKYDRVVFLVCSNGMDWAKKNIQGDDVVYIEGNNYIIDMAVLVRCDHTISTVGSFSWWAGYLAGGEVVYYQWPAKNGTRLRKHYSEDYMDFFPRSWIGMN